MLFTAKLVIFVLLLKVIVENVVTFWGDTVYVTLLCVFRIHMQLDTVFSNSRPVAILN